MSRAEAYGSALRQLCGNEDRGGRACAVAVESIERWAGERLGPGARAGERHGLGVCGRDKPGRPSRAANPYLVLSWVRGTGGVKEADTGGVKEAGKGGVKEAGTGGVKGAGASVCKLGHH